MSLIRFWACKFGCFLALLLTARTGFAESIQIKIDNTHIAPEQKGHGTVILHFPAAEQELKAAYLRVTCVRETGPNIDPAKVLPASSEILKFVIADHPEALAGIGKEGAEIPFDFDAGGEMRGSFRIKAELFQNASASRPIAAAWSETINVSFRPQIRLDGQWDVLGIKVFDYNNGQRPKDWAPPNPPKTVAFPAAFPFDHWFRGWVTVKREFNWKAPANLRPRFVYASGIANSARILVGGEDLGETLPVEDISVLTHWVEYHSPFKGEENKEKRMLALDVDPLPPVTLPLKTALPSEGKAEIEVTIRGTHGQWRPQATYGIVGDLHVELARDVCITGVSFDTENHGEERRFKFKLTIRNDSGREFNGTLRTLYGRYSGKLAYTGSCPTYSKADQPLKAAAGESTVEIIRDETPRFDTCRATFEILDDKNLVVDADGFDFHTVAVEIRDRRDLYLNNERFIVKGQGSSGDEPNGRWNMRIKGGNTFRGWNHAPSKRYPGLWSFADMANDRLTDGLLQSAGSALLASCEKCIFWNPKDTSNIVKAVKNITQTSASSPGVIIWEATNELHGETEECRIAILEAFHKNDPYHRPVLGTKGSGEWEAEAHEGRVQGVDIVGIQYLLSKEATDSITAAVTEQPLLSTEVNWNDNTLVGKGNMWQTWLDSGVCGALLFDYSGFALHQPVPLVAPKDNDNTVNDLLRQGYRDLYQDLVASTERTPEDNLRVTLGNRMPYRLTNLSVTVREFSKFELPDLAPGDAATIVIPAAFAGKLNEYVALRCEYQTHGGLPHIAILTPAVKAKVK